MSRSGGFKDLNIPPFRSINDFVADKSRYEQPPFNDLKRWNQRMLYNLLYYQTNYFACFFALLLVEGIFGPQSFCIGLLSLFMLGGVIFGSVTTHRDIVQLRRDHPFVVLGLIAISVYVFVSCLTHVFFVTFCLLFPVLLVMIHASLRLVNLKSVTFSAQERVGMKTTVMGRILTAMGCIDHAY